MSLVVDGDGIIRDAAFAADGLSQEAGETWLGRRWIDTVTVESRPKVLSLIEDAAPGTVTRWRQVNHPSAQGGADVPIRYAALRIPDDDRIIVIGRDLGRSRPCSSAWPNRSRRWSATMPACAAPRRATGCCSSSPASRS